MLAAQELAFLAAESLVTFVLVPTPMPLRANRFVLLRGPGGLAGGALVTIIVEKSSVRVLANAGANE